MLLTLAKYLAKRGHQIRLYVPYYSPTNFKDGNFPPQELNLGERVTIRRLFSLPYPAGTNQARVVVPTALRWVDLKLFRPDIIHTHHFFGAGFEALVAAKALGVPLLGTNHTAISAFVRYSPFLSQKLATLGLKYVSWYYNHCCFVTAPSEELLTEMVHYGLRKPHCVMPNPIELGIFSPLDQAQKNILKNKFSLSNQTIVYAGRLAAEKNVDEIIKALPLIKRKFPAIILALAGHGKARGTLEQLAANLGVTAQVRFFGTLDKKNLAELFNASELFVSASTSESQPLTLLQALATGLPAVGVRARGLAENIKPNFGVLAEPGDVPDFAHNIISALNDHSTREKYAKAGLIYAHEHDAEPVALAWESLYQSLL